jgi:hypothetical protein
MQYFEDSNPPTNAEIACKMPFLDGHYLYMRGTRGINAVTTS